MGCLGSTDEHVSGPKISYLFRAKAVRICSPQRAVIEYLTVIGVPHRHTVPGTTNYVLLVKIEGPVWCTIYDHLPVVFRGLLTPLFSSTNQWEFGASMGTTVIMIFMAKTQLSQPHKGAPCLSGVDGLDLTVEVF